MEEIKNDQEDVIEELPEVEEGQEDTTDWKALAKKNQGIAKRYQTKLTKAKEDANKPKPKKIKKLEPKVEEKKGFDYAEKAYLKSSDIKSEEFDLVAKIMKDTGKSLDDVLDSKYFQSELTGLREEKASQDAIPEGTKRSTTTTKDKVDYWIAKGEMPPADQPALRREYVNAKTKALKDGNKFSSNPVRGDVRYTK